MAPKNEIVYRNRFVKKYNRLFYDAWKIYRFSPLQGLFWLNTLSRQKKMAARRRKAEVNGLMVPPVLIYSVTNRCNLRCKGCYAGSRTETGRHEIPIERVRKLFREASEMGIGVMMIAGGEPLMRPEILWAASEHRDIIFPVFTNGMLLNDGSISYFKNHRNLIPILSIEGNRSFTDERRGAGVYRQLHQTMARLKQSRTMFGMSITLTSKNFEEVTNPDWLDTNHKQGCNLFFLVEYVPQSQSELSLCLTKKQEGILQSRLEQLRRQLPALFISLPGDEERYGGCLAAGRGFMHISSEGDLEPCPFAPYSDINIGEMSLKESLRSPFLQNIRQSHHLLSEAKGGCVLWENRDWVQNQLQSKRSSVSSMSPYPEVPIKETNDIFHSPSIFSRNRT